jgi:hypothetical protein
MQHFADGYGNSQIMQDNATMIINELNRMPRFEPQFGRMGQAELNKQKSFAITEGVENSMGISGEPGHGPADTIRNFLGLPHISRRGGRSKNKKTNRRKAHRSYTRRRF